MNNWLTSKQDRTWQEFELNLYQYISNISVHVNVLKLWKSSFFLIFENDFSKFVILIILILVFFCLFSVFDHHTINSHSGQQWIYFLSFFFLMRILICKILYTRRIYLISEYGFRWMNSGSDLLITESKYSKFNVCFCMCGERCPDWQRVFSTFLI